VLRALLVVCLLASTASADSWYEGEHGTNRLLHLSIAVVGGASYAALEVPLEDNLAATTCRWCDPTGLDRGVRDLLRWSDDNATSASSASTVSAYALAPAAAVALVALGTFDDASWAQVIDDFTPIAESVVVNAWATRALKVAIGRQRPYAHYAGPRSTEDNLSFPSGHTSYAFAIVTSSAMIARARGYRSEPYIWAVGLTFATAAGYLRIAADKHYLTDVLAGAALGTAAGLTVPLLMRRNAPVVVPTRDGAAVVGSW
jgi:membrane-associated phospholipid phosphatase